MVHVFNRSTAGFAKGDQCPVEHIERMTRLGYVCPIEEFDENEKKDKPKEAAPEAAPEEETKPAASKASGSKKK